jgi:septal ring factor EnvC (AmiA/AmiB activator)
MVTREQMDTLSLRVGTVLELVSELRVENSQLTAAIEQMKVRQEQSERRIDDQSKELLRLREQLEERNQRLNEMILKEEELENYVMQLIGQIDQIKLSAHQAQFVRAAEAKIDGAMPVPADANAHAPLDVFELDFANDSVTIQETSMDTINLNGSNGKALEVIVEDRAGDR